MLERRQLVRDRRGAVGRERGIGRALGYHSQLKRELPPTAVLSDLGSLWGVEVPARSARAWLGRRHMRLQ